ncbi:MAG: flavin reductase family protein [Phycisphaerales bacterium JB060]
MTETNLDPARMKTIVEACDRLATGLYLLSASYDGDRAGILALGAHLCATEPLLICVPVRRGHRIEPLIRDSRAFAVSSVSPDDRSMRRRFERYPPAEQYHDPFNAIGVLTLETGAPIPESSALAFDCEVVRHVDMDADHELYIGRVVDARLNGDAPAPTRASLIGPLHLD